MTSTLYRKAGGWLLCAVALVGLTSVSGAKEPASLADNLLALQVRQSLRAEKGLAGLNLGSEVVGGVVTLWGPLANARQAQLAQACVEKLAGVQQVRTEFTLATFENTVRPEPTSSLSGQPKQHSVYRRAEESALSLPTLVNSAATATTRGTDAPFSSGVSWGDPVSPPASPPTLVTNVGVPVTGLSLGQPKGRAVAQASSLATPVEAKLQVEAVRRSEARFGGISVNWEQNTVYLLGTGPALHELAKKVSELAGVERVVLVHRPS